MGKSSPPKAPDPATTIAAQSQANLAGGIQNAELNRVNQNTPYGSSNYAISGYNQDGTPQYTQNTTLAPAQQGLLDLQNRGATSLGNTAVGMLGQIGNSYAKPIDTSGIPGLSSSVTPTSGTPGITSNIQGGGADVIRQAQDAAYNTQTQYLDPQFKQGQDQLDNSRINQGITQGSEAYNNAQQGFDANKNQAYQGARNAATQAGFQEQNTLFNQGAQQADLNNSANAQGFGQGQANAALGNQANQLGLQNLFSLRNQPLNEYNALATGAQVQQPNFQNVPGANVATTDVGGITNSSYQQQLQAYQAKLAANPMNNIFNLAGQVGAAFI